MYIYTHTCIYVHVYYVYIFIYNVHVYIYTYIDTIYLRVCTYIHLYACVYKHINVCINIHAYRYALQRDHKPTNMHRNTHRVLSKRTFLVIFNSDDLMDYFLKSFGLVQKVMQHTTVCSTRVGTTHFLQYKKIVFFLCHFHGGSAYNFRQDCTKTAVVDCSFAPGTRQ